MLSGSSCMQLQASPIIICVDARTGASNQGPFFIQIKNDWSDSFLRVADAVNSSPGTRVCSALLVNLGSRLLALRGLLLPCWPGSTSSAGCPSAYIFLDCCLEDCIFARQVIYFIAMHECMETTRLLV